VVVCAADATTLELLAEKQNAHSDGIESVAFSPDGTRVVSGALESIDVWSWTAGRPSRLVLINTVVEHTSAWGSDAVRCCTAPILPLSYPATRHAS
jgi:WD40 repeat protein